MAKADICFSHFLYLSYSNFSSMRIVVLVIYKERKIEKIIKKIYFLKNPIAIRFIAGYN